MTMTTHLEERRRAIGRSAPLKLRIEHALEALRAEGVIGGPKDKTVSVRMEAALLAAAREITGIESDSELMRIALANLVAADEFGPWLLTQAGRLPPDFRLEL
jgi:hypothetical protein